MARTTPFINSSTITDGAGDLVQRWEYYADSTVKYAGYAPRGTLVSQDHWQIIRYQYTNQQAVLRESAYGAWSDRDSLVYA